MPALRAIYFADAFLLLCLLMCQLSYLKKVIITEDHNEILLHLEYTWILAGDHPGIFFMNMSCIEHLRTSSGCAVMCLLLAV